MAFVLSENTIISATKVQVSTNLSGEAIILNLEDGVYYGLDLVGSRVWELVQTPLAVKEIVQRLVEEYEVEPDICQRDVKALLQNMAEHGLVEMKNESPG